MNKALITLIYFAARFGLPSAVIAQGDWLEIVGQQARACANK